MMVVQADSPNADERNPIETLIDEFLRRLGEGENITVKTFAAEYPEHEQAIRQILPTVLAMEKYKRGREVNVGGRASLGGHKLEKLGDFRLIRELGRGGMGVVYEAVQETLGRKVAIKILPNQHLLGTRQVERFEREARVAASLHHTNIVPIFGTGEQDGYHFFVMQLIRGITLAELVTALREQRDGRVSESVPATEYASAKSLAAALRKGVLESLSGGARGERAYWHAVAMIGVQVADALGYAHQQRVLHRDIKPSNLMLDAQGRVWMTDFGLSKAPADAGSMTQTGCLAGTPAYLAPEQVDGKYDIRTDIHGLGLVLYELLCLQPAFQERDQARLINLITSREPDPPGRFAPRLPRDLETIVVKCLACDPVSRYQTADDLRRDLRFFVEGQPITARRITLLERGWQWCGRNPGMAWLATSTLVAVIAAMIIGWIAYGTTREALDNESLQARRAEENLDLALEAIGGAFDHSGPGPDVTTTLTDEGEEWIEPMVQPAVDSSHAKLLERLVVFFDRFVEANKNSPQLREKRILAYSKMGDIHQRLGNYDEALAAYEKALVGLRWLGSGEVKQALHQARVHNEIGRVRRRTGDNLRCLEAHRKARKVLEVLPAGQLSARGKYELARTLNFIGSFRLDPNSTLGGVIMSLNKLDSTLPFLTGGSAKRETASEGYHLQAAALGEVLLKIDPDRLEYRFLQAHSSRLLAAAFCQGGKEEQGLAALRRAYELLEVIVEEQPQIDFYCFELAQVHMLAASLANPGSSFAREVSLGKGLELFSKLYQRNPDNVLFTASYARCRMRLASFHSELGDVKQAEENYRQAMDYFDRLLTRVKGLANYRLLNLRCLKDLARLLANQGRKKEAATIWETAKKKVDAALGMEGMSAMVRLNLIKEQLLLRAGW